MNILYSTSGEGFGHAARVIALSEQLIADHQLTFWCPDTVKGFLQTAFPSASFRLIPILKLVKENHRINLIKTGFETIPLLFFSFSLINDLAQVLIDKKIDMVISDYEPLVCRAAKKAGVPVLGLSHQGVIDHKWFDGVDHFFAKLANRSMMPHYQDLIVTSFYNGDVGPILRQQVVDSQPSDQGYVFVYLKKSFKSHVLPLLEAYPEINFKFFPHPEIDFVEGLAAAKAVIAPAGHQLMCECLYLKKPVIVFPEDMQYEQRLNAIMLERSGWGMNAYNGDYKKNLDYFLGNLDQFPKDAKANDVYCFENDTHSAKDKIEAFIQKHVPVTAQ